MQYGSKGLLGKKFADIEEKYDLSEATDGFGEEGEETDGDESEEDNDDNEDSGSGDESNESGFLDDSFEAY
jgi:hypothetical protein